MRRRKLLAIVSWSLVLITLFALSFYGVKSRGDGHEYLLYAVAFASHGSPDIRQEDMEETVEILDLSPGHWVRGIFEKQGKGSSLTGGAQCGGGLCVTASGELYSWHFWLYPALVTPLMKIFEALEWPPLFAFVAANWVFVGLALGYLAMRWQATSLQKHLLAILFLLTGTTYYLRWIHPEAFTAALVLLALMLASDRRLVLAMFAAATAATQNPPVIFLVFVIGVFGSLQYWRQRGADGGDPGSPRNIRVFAVAVAGALLVALTPVMFFKWKLGVANPIAASGAADASLVSWSRLHSFFLDLNQGWIVAAPGLLIGIGVLVPMLLLQGGGVGGWRSGVARLTPLFLGVAMSVALALPALSTGNWNHGQSVFSRYAYWAGVPILFGFVWSMKYLSTKVAVGIATVVVFLQSATVVSYGVIGRDKSGSETGFKPFAAYVLREFPGLYNPEPEIFLDRLNGKELVIVPPERGGRDVFVFPSGDSPRKLLMAEEDAVDWSRKCKDASLKRMGKGWAYLSVSGAGECVRGLIAGRSGR